MARRASSVATALAVCALAACGEPSLRATPDEAVLAGPAGAHPDGAPIRSQAPAALREEAGAPPNDARTVSADLLARIDTTAEAGGVFGAVGVYHSDDAPAADGEQWLALDSAGGAWALVPVTVRTRIVRDEIVDDPDGPFTGVEVRTERSTRRHDAWHDPAAVFVRSARLAPGPVQTAFAGLRSLAPGTELTLALGETTWQLASAALAGRPDQAVLLLDDVPVVSLPSRDAGNRILHWAGDLDGDGALDLVVNASDHYNASVLQLWLSSAADGGAPLGLAATHTATGC